MAEITEEAVLEGVRAELALIPERAGPAKEEDWTAHATRLMRIARFVLEGRAAMIEGHPLLAAKAFEKGAALDETKMMAQLSDPPAWWYPVRRSLAAAELAGGDNAQAAIQARAVLARTPDDPLTLFVLAHAQKAQGQAAEAEQTLARAHSLWRGHLSDQDLAGA